MRSRGQRFWAPARQAARRLGWGVADQAVSSLTNFAVSIYIARTLGAAQYGAFSLAYVTYGFALNASRGLATDPLLVRFSGTDLPTWRRAVANCTGTAAVTGLATGVCRAGRGCAAERPDQAGLPRARTDTAGTPAAGQLAIRVLRARARQPGISQRHDLGGGTASRPAVAAGDRPRETSSGLSSRGARRRRSRPPSGRCRPGSCPGCRARGSGCRSNVTSGARYLAEGTANSAAAQLRNYGVGLILGLAAARLPAGCQHADGSLPGHPLRDGPGRIAGGRPDSASLATAHAAVLRAAQRRALSAGLAWGVALLVALPRGLGNWLLGSIWRPTYPLVLPTTLFVMGGCASAGAGTWLHALGAARRSLRAAVLTSVVYVVCSPWSGPLRAERSGRSGALRSEHGSAPWCIGGSCDRLCGSPATRLPITSPSGAARAAPVIPERPQPPSDLSVPLDPCPMRPVFLR